MSAPTKIAVLITCFNRKATTLASISALNDSVIDARILEIYLVDDGSGDGTSEAVTLAYPGVHIIRGDGSLYWNGGMRRAWEEALSAGADFYLWLNDDLALLPGSLDDLLATYRRLAIDDPDYIIVGKTRSTDRTTDTYGGRMRASSISRLRFRPLREGEAYCDTMNGNCVLIPAQAVEDIGLNSQSYRHSMGDMDYGLRARKAGYKLYQSDQPVGYQDANPIEYSRPKSRNWKAFVSFMEDPKGMPIKEWFHFCRQHGGWLWPINFASMYVKAIFFSFAIK